jgi:peptidoglycan/xylan/chitin deacetylase (PgdA/CDA1 family)
MLGITLMKKLLIFGISFIWITIFLIFGQNFRGKKVVYSVHTHQKIVALTFDDGPYPDFTLQLVDILDKYHVPATFFMIGSSIRKYPYIVKQVIAQGHSIGNHTYTHPVDMAVCSKEQIVTELNNCEAMIKQLSGWRTFIFRPPRGHFNHKVVEIAQAKRYQMVLWSVCGDKGRGDTPELIAERVIGKVHPGAIILLQ